MPSRPDSISQAMSSLSLVVKSLVGVGVPLSSFNRPPDRATIAAAFLFHAWGAIQSLPPRIGQDSGRDARNSGRFGARGVQGCDFDSATNCANRAAIFAGESVFLYPSTGAPK